MSADRPGKGLGKGLSALLGEQGGTTASDDSGMGGVREVEVGRISPNPSQPRQHFDEESLDNLARSIVERGVLQPILLRETSDGGYQIIAGERRWRAAQRARLHRIPAIVREADERATAELALIENIQREDLNAIEEGEGYRKLVDAHGYTQEALAKIVHKSRSHVANLIRLRDLPDVAKQALLRGDISMGHARAVLGAPDAERLVGEIVARGLSVRQTEAKAKRAKAPAGELILEERAVDSDLAALQRQLADLLGIRVDIAHKGKSGAVTLHYSSLDQLDMICQRLSGEPI